MKNMTCENVAAACDGRLLHCEEILGRPVSSVVTDSRKVDADALYIPMKGENADGHDYIEQAFAKGALFCLTERAEASGGHPAILVEDCALAIQKIAGFYRQQLDVKVVGITGSVGKTSTKEAVANVCRQHFNVLATEGNFNNNLGLPLTIFRIREAHEIAVLEMGISHFGEMALLGETARPDVMVFTNIGDCHLAFLGDRDGVYKAKTECLPYLSGERIVIANGEDEELQKLAAEEQVKTLFYGRDDAFRVYAEEILPLGENGTRCRIVIDDEAIPVKIPMPGEHFVMNALVAAAVGAYFGLSADEIKAGIESVDTIGGRFKIEKLGARTLIDDAYNANPASMRAALSTLATFPGEKLAILGDMGELGAREKALHEELGAYAGTLAIDRFLLAGTLAEEIRRGILSQKPDADVRHFADTDTLLASLPETLPAEGNILVKASHFMGFDRVVSAIRDM